MIRSAQNGWNSPEGLYDDPHHTPPSPANEKINLENSGLNAPPPPPKKKKKKKKKHCVPTVCFPSQGQPINDVQL